MNNKTIKMSLCWHVSRVTHLFIYIFRNAVELTFVFFVLTPRVILFGEYRCVLFDGCGEIETNLACLVIIPIGSF